MHWLDFLDLLGMAFIGTTYIWNWVFALLVTVILLPFMRQVNGRPGWALATKMPTIYLLGGLPAWLVHAVSGWRFSWGYAICAGISVTLASMASAANQIQGAKQEYLQTGDPTQIRAAAYSGFIPFIVLAVYLTGCAWQGFVDNPLIRSVHGTHKWFLNLPVIGFGLGILIVLFFLSQIVQGVMMGSVIIGELRNRSGGL